MEDQSDAEYSGNDTGREDSEYTGNVKRSMMRTVNAVAAIVVKELIVLVKAIITAMTNIIGVCILCVVIVVVSVTGIFQNVNDINGSEMFANNRDYSASAQGVVNIACAYAEQGIAETGNNNVIFNTRYYGHEVEGSQYSWCVVFVYCCFEDAFGERVDDVCSKVAVVSGLKATLLEHGGTE
ncbi:MAG: hypothetical protein ACI4L2_07725, partial [Wujia sp.]